MAEPKCKIELSCTMYSDKFCMRVEDSGDPQFHRYHTMNVVLTVEKINGGFDR